MKRFRGLDIVEKFRGLTKRERRFLFIKSFGIFMLNIVGIDMFNGNIFCKFVSILISSYTFYIILNYFMTKKYEIRNQKEEYNTLCGVEGEKWNKK